ncbi:enhanced serine sensitivity protein SseB [Hymenobacter tibetensis]|uniref:Enhanced serine sensitivity protein SseB n=1 Tax=Hymenobacter tibetensis TaxID=497967 RepID=A0ABY4CVL1_9BACT|nr:enhanced serine sensitivity protein SseB [Hymenobacter tibetensis]UOG73031.1 enhanced serine sensitivity protein SseB [Hymenobacter tibetensis]
MGLFDFLKKKPEAPQTPPAAAPDTTTTPAAAPAGPRYKGSNYTMPTQEQAPPIPPMPLIPEPAYGQPQIPDFPFPPSNILEELLMRAANEPNIRPAFYQALLHEELLAVTLPKEGDAGGEVPLTPGMEIQLQVLNDGKIPVFSAVERIFEGGIAPEGVSFIRVRGQDLLQMIQATDCVLNPFSPAGKLLTSQEMQELLASDLIHPPTDPASQVPVQIGAPAEPPTVLLDALREYCATRPFIEKAYLAELRVENSPEPPRILLAFQSDEQNAEFLQELGPVIEGRLEGYQFVDMMVLDPNADEPLNQYFNQQEPFFQR